MKAHKIRDKIISILGFISYVFLSIFFFPLTFVWWLVNDESLLDSNIFVRVTYGIEHYGGNL